MKKLIILFLIFMITSPSYASEWINIGQNLYLDKLSVKYNHRNRTYKAWIKETNSKEIILYFNEYNLNEREWRNIDKVTMDLQNKVTSRDTSNSIGKSWINVTPDSNSELEYQAIKKETAKTDKEQEKELHID